MKDVVPWALWLAREKNRRCGLRESVRKEVNIYGKTTLGYP